MKTSIRFFSELSSKFFNIFLEREIMYAAISTAKKNAVCCFVYKKLNIAVRYLPMSDSFRLTISNNSLCISIYTKNNSLEILHTNKKPSKKIEAFDWDNFPVE